MAVPSEEHRGRYLTVEALDFLSVRLLDSQTGLVSWRQLAGQLEYTSLHLGEFIDKGLKAGESAPKVLLCDWQRRCGGCDVNKLKDSLQKIRRNDILRDLSDYFENQGKEIVEPRHNGPRKISDDGQYIVIKGKIYPDGKLALDPNVTWVGQDYSQDNGVQRHQEACPVDSHLGRGVPNGHSVNRQEHCSVGPSQRRDLSSQGHWSSNGPGRGDSHAGVVIEQDFHVPTKRHSDPLQRKDPSSQQSWSSHSSGSLDSVQKADPPKNLKKIYSEQLSQEPSVECALSGTPSKVVKEEESFQRVGDYGELRSVPPVHANGNGHLPRHTPAIGHIKQYLVVSSENEQDKLWSKKLCKILVKKGHRAWALHTLPYEELLPFFRAVDYVLVIYTAYYKREFQQRGNPNWILFDAMQKEFKMNRSNHRFIPVYDVNAIHQLPDALMSGQSQERDYILQLLSCSNKNSSTVHSSAPSEGGVGRAGVAPMRCNHQHLSKSEPVIQREFHTPQNQIKPANPEKKETQSKFFKFRSKKGK